MELLKQLDWQRKMICGGAVKSGVGDVFDIVGTTDLFRLAKGIKGANKVARPFNTSSDINSDTMTQIDNVIDDAFKSTNLAHSNINNSSATNSVRIPSSSPTPINRNYYTFDEWAQN